jgi:hypothetical protein
MIIKHVFTPFQHQCLGWNNDNLEAYDLCKFPHRLDTLTLYSIMVYIVMIVWSWLNFVIVNLSVNSKCLAQYK